MLKMYVDYMRTHTPHPEIRDNLAAHARSWYGIELLPSEDAVADNERNISLKMITGAALAASGVATLGGLAFGGVVVARHFYPANPVMEAMSEQAKNALLISAGLSALGFTTALGMHYVHNNQQKDIL